MNLHIQNASWKLLLSYASLPLSPVVKLASQSVKQASRQKHPPQKEKKKNSKNLPSNQAKTPL
jgi:hypothetical protein